MPRKVTQSPLEGAAPSLNPTARPLSIPIGATPAPHRSPLMELGDAFREFNPELRDMLRDASIREEHNALAAGELEAQKQNAAARMGEIETTLKQAVDEGKVSHVRLPAFERGFRMRAGKDLAQSLFQEKLLSQLPDAMRVEGRVDPEKIISDTYAEVSKQIHPDDFYAREAFDATAQGVTAGFRQRAAEGYTAEYKKAVEQKIADEGSELAFQLASAPEEYVPALRDSVRAHLDQVRKELPKSEVNEFYVRNVVSPAVTRLVSEQKFDEARHLMLELENLDVTGKGGLLSQTSVAKSVFANLRAHLEEQARASDYDGYTKLKRNHEIQTEQGEVEAATQMNKLRLDHDGRLNPEDRFRLIDDFRKANEGDPLRVQGFAAAVHREYENEDKYRSNERATAELETSIKSLNKDDLAAGRDRLNALYYSQQVSPRDYVRISQHIEKLDALYGTIDESDFNHFHRDLYSAPGIGGKTVNFGDPNAAPGKGSVDLWSKLPDDLQTEHETRVTKFFSDTLQAEIRAIGDPNKVPAEKSGALDRATVKAREYARTLLRDLTNQSIKDGTQKAVKKQADAIKQASSIVRLGDGTPTLEYAATRKVRGAQSNVPGEAEGPAHTEVFLKTYVLPKADSQKLALNYANKPSESDVGQFRAPGDTLSEFVDLKALAKDATSGDSKYLQRTAREAYGHIKSSLGFTPEEIKAGKTKHGVEFNPAEIDPRRISVFRDVAELNKHWNNNQPDETFMAVGDAVDSHDKLKPRDFYLAQRALLKR